METLPFKRQWSWVLFYNDFQKLTCFLCLFDQFTSLNFSVQVLNGACAVQQALEKDWCRYWSRNTGMTENTPWLWELSEEKAHYVSKSSKLCLLKGDQVQVFLSLNTSVVIHTELLTMNRCRLQIIQINISKTSLSEKKILILEVEISSIEGVNFKNTLYF